MKVSYVCSGRLGNNLFQYFTAKLLTLLLGHTYVPVPVPDAVEMDDGMYLKFCSDPRAYEHLKEYNIRLNGFFQYDTLLLKHRETLLDMAALDNDIIYQNQPDLPPLLRYKDIFSRGHKCEPNSVTLHLRLDDFIHNIYNSEVLPLSYYQSILDSADYSKVYIVCQPPRTDWERAYIKSFDKYAPLILSGELLDDIAALMHSDMLILSNSTLSWMIYYVASNIKKAYVPQTHFHSGQKLTIWRDTDVLVEVDLKRN